MFRHTGSDGPVRRDRGSGTSLLAFRIGHRDKVRIRPNDDVERVVVLEFSEAPSFHEPTEPLRGVAAGLVRSKFVVQPLRRWWKRRPYVPQSPWKRAKTPSPDPTGAASSALVAPQGKGNRI